jgi:PIN domain nuclease of toxin-antitoxin system
MPSRALALVEDSENDLFYSVVSLWEVAIKSGAKRTDFDTDPRLLQRELQDNGYNELNVTGGHALAISSLPPIHRDPFDRMLAAQALTEGLMLLTNDRILAKYPCRTRLFSSPR